jgi:hypothetical protein
LALPIGPAFLVPISGQHVASPFKPAQILPSFNFRKFSQAQKSG